MGEKVDLDSIIEQLEDDYGNGWADIAVGCVQCIGIHIIGGLIDGTWYFLTTDSQGNKSCGLITPDHLRDFVSERDKGTYDCFCNDV